MHYYLDEETNDGINPTTAKDENSSEVPVTEKYNETLPVSTAQSTTESYRITSTEKNKNNDNSSEIEPEDELMKVSTIFQ